MDHLVVTPTNGSIQAGGAQSLIAKGYDAYGNDLGEVTAAATPAITPDGSCTANTCTATVARSHTITGTP